ncbi:MAG: hypothetical protein ABIU87_03000 [Ornithinibacter sp.]
MAASVTDRFTISLDSDGATASFTESISVPRSVWTNTETGDSIVMAGHYIQVANRVPRTNKFHRTVTRSQSPVSEPRNGAATKDAGRTLNDEDVEDSTWSDLTGQHHFADAALTEPTPCTAIE